MKQIHSLNELNKELQTISPVWLLLFKRGSEQSDCAFVNYEKAVSDISGQQFLHADVNSVRDIHAEFDIRTVPSLLEFEAGKLKNIIKGCHQAEHFTAIFENAIFVPGATSDGKPSKSVTVYTTPTCSWCTTLKRHLDVHNIRYREVDVSKDQKAAEAMVRKSGQQGVPQMDINGQTIVGFDRERINRLLEIK